MKTCIVIPAYNEAENILNVVQDIKINAQGADYILINDCSTDNSIQIMEEHNLNYISLPVNLGLAGAVQTGYKYAYENGYDCAIQFDGDGQHKAKYILELSKAIEEGADIAIGSRFVTEKKNGSLRMIGSRIITFFIKMKTGKTIKDPTSGMRMLNSKMIRDYAYNMNRQPEPDTLVYQMKRGAVVKEVQVEMSDRIAGTSLYSNMWHSISYMFRTVISIIFIS